MGVRRAGPRLALFDRAEGERLAAAERLVLSWPELFPGALERCDLLFDRASRLFVAAAHFAPGREGPEVRARFDFWAAKAGGRSASAGALPPEEAQALDARLRGCDVRREGVPPAALPQAFDKLGPQLGRAPTRRATERVRAELEVDLGALGPSAWTHDVSAGGVFVRSTVLPLIGEELDVRLHVPGTEAPFTVRARVSHVRGTAGARAGGQPPGFGLAFLAPPEALQDALARLLAGARASAHSAHSAHPAHPAQRRALPRLSFAAPGAPSTLRPVAGAPSGDADAPEALRLRYESEQALARDYVENLSLGGAFVRTERPPPVSTPVELVIELPGGRALTTFGHVVHVVAGGVGVQFELGPPARAELEALVQRALHPHRVLVVEEDPLLRSLLEAALVQQGFGVRTASDGAAGVAVLLEELFSLEAVLVSLQLPGAGGRQLVELVRRAGGEHDLTLVLTTVRLDAEARALQKAADVDALVDKRMGPERIAEAVAEAAAARRRRPARH
jgi:CheY-like chemotaxis protein